MALYLLYESASGYALFHARGLDEIGQNTEAVRNSVSDLNRFGKVVQLTAFSPFQSALDALKQCNSVSEGNHPEFPNFGRKPLGFSSVCVQCVLSEGHQSYELPGG